MAGLDKSSTFVGGPLSKRAMAESLHRRADGGRAGASEGNSRLCFVDLERAPQLVEQPQGIGVGQRLRILDLTTMNRVAHRQLADLSADGPRDVGNLENFFRYVKGTRVVANLLSDALAEPIIELIAFPETHEQHDLDVS